MRRFPIPMHSPESRTYVTTTANRGRWALNSVPGGTEVFARHEFQLIPDACRNVFGDGDISSYKKRLHHALETNSLTTIESCERRLAGRELQ